MEKIALSGDSDPEESSTYAFLFGSTLGLLNGFPSVSSVPFKLYFFHHFQGESLQAGPSMISLLV